VAGMLYIPAIKTYTTHPHISCVRLYKLNLQEMTVFGQVV